MKSNATPRTRLLLLALAGTLALTACKSARNGELLSSFEDISAGHVAVGLKMHQVRTMSINGQMPFTDIGSLYYYKPDRGNLAAIGMTFANYTSDPVGLASNFVNQANALSDSAFKLAQSLTNTPAVSTNATAGCTNAPAKTNCPPVGAQMDITNKTLVANSATNLASLATNLASSAALLTTSATKLSAAAENFPLHGSYEVIQSYESKCCEQCKGRQCNLALVTSLRAKLVEMAAAAGELVSARLEQGTNAPQKSGGGENADKVPAKPESASTNAAANAASNSTTTKDATAAQPTAGPAKSAVQVAREKLNQKTADALKKMDRANVMIFRWQADRRKDISGNIGDPVSAKFRSELGRSGFVIVTGLRSRTLYLNEAGGRGLQTQVNRRLPVGADTFLTDWWFSVYGAGFHVVSHLWEADTIAYLSEESLMRALEIHAEVNPKEMDAKSIDKLKLDLAFSSIASVANAGVIQCTSVTKKPVIIGGLPGSNSGTNGTWTPIMAVTTRLRDLDELWAKCISTNKTSTATSPKGKH